MTVRFRLLGQVDACIADRYVDVGPARQRCVLAALLVDVNRCVPADQLVERVWGGGRLPDRPRNALRTYISLLRRILAGAITRQSDGYVINVDESLVDMHCFRGLVRQARSADEPRAVLLFEQALALWEGEAFGMLDTPWLNDLRTALGEERQAAERDLVDIQLRLGQHSTLLARLTEWTDARPLDEHLAGQVMLARFRAGRQADALRHYERMCRLLTEELGTDPGRALQRLHQRILADDATLYVDRPVAVTTSSRTTVPRQLPATPRLFTARARELASISEAVDGAGAPVVTIGGASGIGKTWLALHWAHRNLGRFPDGQLYIDLRGSHPEPTVPGTAVRCFLAALGVDRATMPLDPGHAGRAVPQPGRGPADADRAGQRPRHGAGPATAAGWAGLHRAGDQPPSAGQTGQRARRARGGPGRVLRAGERTTARPVSRCRSAGARTAGNGRPAGPLRRTAPDDRYGRRARRRPPRPHAREPRRGTGLAGFRLPQWPFR